MCGAANKELAAATCFQMGGHRGSGVKTCDVTSLGDHVLKAINAG